MSQGFVEFCENCCNVSRDRFLAFVLKKPPQGQVKEEKLVPISDGSEHLALKCDKCETLRRKGGIKIDFKSKSKIEKMFQMSSFPIASY